MVLGWDRRSSQPTLNEKNRPNLVSKRTDLDAHIGHLEDDHDKDEDAPGVRGGGHEVVGLVVAALGGGGGVWGDGNGRSRFRS